MSAATPIPAATTRLRRLRRVTTGSIAMSGMSSDVSRTHTGPQQLSCHMERAPRDLIQQGFSWTARVPRDSLNPVCGNQTPGFPASGTAAPDSRSPRPGRRGTRSAAGRRPLSRRIPRARANQPRASRSLCLFTTPSSHRAPHRAPRTAQIILTRRAIGKPVPEGLGGSNCATHRVRCARAGLGRERSDGELTAVSRMRKTGLLIAARRNLRDARVTSISPEARLEAAYKAIMQSALAALITSASDWQHHLLVPSLPIDSVGATWADMPSTR